MRRTIPLAALFAALFFASTSMALPVENVLKAYLSRQAGDYKSAAENLRAALKADPQSIELRLRLVRLLMVFGEPDQSNTLLDEGLKLNPDNADLYFEKAKYLVITGKTAEALPPAKMSAEKGGGDKAYTLAIRVMATLGDFDNALLYAQKWIDSGPANPTEAYGERGAMYFKLGKLTEAAADFNKVLEKNPNNQKALDGLASVASNKGDKAEAIRLYDLLLKGNPHLTQAHFAKIQLLLENDDLEPARLALAEAQRFVGNDLSDMIKLALFYLQADLPEKCLALMQAIPEEQRDERVWFFLGIAQLELDKNDESIKSFGKIPQESFLFEEAMIRKAAAVKAAGRTDEAVASLETLVSKNPDSFEAAKALSAMLQTLERHKEGIDVLEGYLSRHSDSKDPTIFFNLGVLYDKAGDWQKSVELMKKVLELSPEDAHALNYLGYTWADHDVNLEEAEKLLIKAVSIMPKNGFIADSLGWAYYKLGKFDEAVKELSRATGLSPTDAVIWEHLGDARLKAGDREGAKKDYQKALELAPDSKTIPKKLEELP